MAEDTVPLAQYLELERKCDHLNSLVEEYRSRLTQASTKLARAKAAVKRWQHYVDTHPKYVKSEQSTTPTGYQTDTIDAEVLNVELPTGNATEEQRVTSNQDDLHRNASSQTTQADTDDRNAVIKSEPHSEDDFEPIFVSSRIVRKAKPSRPNEGIRHAGTRSDPYKIKREESDVSQVFPNVQAPAPIMPYTQMSDLDALAKDIQTPRKRQRLMSSNDGGAAASLDGHHGNPVLLAAPGHALRSPDENEPRTGSVVGLLQHRASSGPLQPLSVNTPTLPRTSDVHAKSTSSKKRREPTSQRVKDMGEDGPDIAAADPPSERKGRRLDNLLQGAVTPQSKTPLSRTRIISDPATAYRTPQTVTRPVKREPVALPEQIERTNTPSTVSRVPRQVSRPRSRASDGPPSAQGDSTPLREKPLSALTLDDFRINPLHAGSSFAYTMSVRDSATRACLPGCTLPCCAALQAFAPSSPRSDAAALKAWLGTEDTSHLSAAERQTLLATARAEKFARQHGRHRQIFERAKTPPGFWNTDMPSTQEVEEQRAQAKREAELEVSRRWAEALKARGKGRWRFRDEV